MTDNPKKVPIVNKGGSLPPIRTLLQEDCTVIDWNSEPPMWEDSGPYVVLVDVFGRLETKIVSGLDG